ncbi:MAG: hypothetical protein AAF549_05710 [Pseudomonadota bacterium]
MSDLKERWKTLYQQDLPQFAKDHNWLVYEDHCIARIIYDHVAGDKWDRVWQKPAIHNINENELEKCIAVGHQLMAGELNAEALNKKSLQYRGKI